ncbi:calmodulin-lysine N-methyltransferase [Ceratina calcarata]|uniref:Calmodulin-lysine N-methyltransferase n=1 Tax=Ceratina calcarata TaxID=156304 RepID=A0AAJ7RW78_9HYME|nr:calmodulin-lysine N-methyltransferase [Ceratina calcarata]
MSEKSVREPTANDIPKEKITRKKKNTAQRRWRILAKALIGSRRSMDTEDENEVSVRRFTSFQLFRVNRVDPAMDQDAGVWSEYSAVAENKLFTLQIHRLKRNFTANELIGFNNTGNICVWPSEECLAYYLLKNRHLCRDRRVLELGGGMSCLAGMIAAKYCDPRQVTLTDGNVTSANNVQRIVARNGMSDLVECGVVQWGRAARAIRMARASRAFAPNEQRVKNWTGGGGKDLAKFADRLYDVILCADCLFFDEARSDLVETMYGWLANDGLALVMAPGRGSTFEKFAEAAVKRGFVARQIDRYDGKIWSRHLELLEHSQEYCPDLHYPILLELTKQKKTLLG